MAKLIIFFYLILGVCLSSSSQEIAINANLSGQRWPASWIKASDGSVNGYGVYHFRKVFDLTSKPSKFVVHVSADNRYKLYVNEELVSLGPARADIYNWPFETVDIAPYLKKGKNVLAAVVWNYGAHLPVAQMSFYKTGFILQGDSEPEQIANTNTTWKSFVNSSYQPTTTDLQTYYVAGPGDQVNGELYPWKWETGDYDDSLWKEAVAIMVGAGKGAYDYPGWQLVPRQIPQMELTNLRIPALRKAEGINKWSGFPQKKGNYTVPAGSKISLLIDQTYLTTAYFNAEFSKGKGAKIKIKYAESLFEDRKDDKERFQHKGNRNEVEGKVFLGYYDEILPDGGTNRLFTSLWWRTYRYVLLEIETSQEPLILHDVYGEFTAYPFEQVSRFESRQQPELQDILSTGWRTARLCAHETYEDCPYYEQLQYFGDTRIQAMISLYNTRDDRLIKNAIDNGRQSIISDGITMSRYPTSLHQFIPSFSIWWIATVHDYWMYRGDDQFISRQLSATRSILNFYEQYLGEDGSLSKIPYWFFTDWTAGFESGMPPRAADGKSAIQDLHFLYGLQLAAEMEKELGEPALGARYEALAARIALNFKDKYWNEKRNLFADTPLSDSFSQHTNILAILTGLIDGEKARSVLKTLLADESITQASIYFRYYLHMALVKGGLGNNYLEMMDLWHTQLSLGLTTWAEQPEPSRSDCHAWGSSPNIEVFRTVLGIKSDAPGFKKIRIQPHLGNLREVKGSIPHPLGDVVVNYQVNDTDFLAVIDLPMKTTGILQWRGKEFILKPGLQQIKITH